MNLARDLNSSVKVPACGSAGVFFVTRFRLFVRNSWKNSCHFFRYRTFLYDWKGHCDGIDL